MALRTCDKCLEFYDETVPQCPHCGQKNDRYMTDEQRAKKPSFWASLGKAVKTIIVFVLALFVIALGNAIIKGILGRY